MRINFTRTAPGNKAQTSIFSGLYASIFIDIGGIRAIGRRGINLSIKRMHHFFYSTIRIEGLSGAQERNRYLGFGSLINFTNRVDYGLVPMFNARANIAVSIWAELIEA